MNHSGPERRAYTPVEIRKISNGAKIAMISIVLLILGQLVAIVAFIVTTSNRLTALEDRVANHIAIYEPLLVNINREIGEVKVLLEEHDKGTQ